MFPLFTVLAPKKDTATYIAILKKIRELHPEFKPARCHLDYEDAERLAMEEVFPETKLSGCWFHFCQVSTNYSFELLRAGLSRFLQ